MPIYLKSIQIKPEFEATADPTPFLRSNIGTKVRVDVDFYIETSAISDSTTDSSIVFAPTPIQSGQLNNGDLIWAQDGVSFADFNVGDEITAIGVTVPSNAGPHTITQKFSDGLIKVSSPVSSETLIDNGAIYVTSLYNYLDYSFNFIGNNDTTDFANKIDGEVGGAFTTTANHTAIFATAIPFKGKKTYQTGLIRLAGVNAGILGQQHFKIIHNTVVTPTHLAGQFDDTVAGIKPVYYDNAECLKYICEIKAGIDSFDTSRVQSLIVDEENGNSGWWNERLNTGVTNYSISNVVIQRTSDSAILGGIDYNNECTVSWSVTNTVDSPFTASSGYEVMHSFLPEFDSQYTNNLGTFDENFLYDNALSTSGSSSVGDKFGGTFQVIKSVVPTFVSASQIDFVATLEFGADAKEVIDAATNKRYALGCHIGEDLQRDNVNLLVNLNTYHIEQPTANLVNATTVFIQHPYTSRLDGSAGIETFPVDDLSANSNFTVDFTNLVNFKFLSINPQVVLKKAGEADIILESKTLDVRNTQQVGLWQNILLNINRAFQINENSIRTVITANRETSLDTGNTFGWNINYPFFNRWEFWESIGLLSSLPSDLFDSNLDFNGFNHFWYRYSSIAGWDINYRLLFTYENDGDILQQSFDSPMVLFDFNSNPDWTNESIKSYDPTSGLELINGGTKFISGLTRIEANFTHVSAIPDIADLEMTIWVIIKENGTINDIRRVSSVYSTDSLSYFQTDQITKTILGNTITGSTLINGDDLTGKDYTIYARLYDKSIAAVGRLLESGDFRLLEDGDFRLLEDQ